MSRNENYTHYSQISTYLSCRKKNHFAYEERLEPVRRVARMDFGTFGHAALADLWRGHAHGPTLTEALDAALEHVTGDPVATQEVLDLARTAKEVADRLFPALSERFEPYEDNIEKTLTVQVPGASKPFGGTPDAIVRDRQSGALWILDYKFRANFLEQDSEWLNLQMITYSWLAHEHDIPVVGTRQIQIIPALPKVPVMNKTGGMSKAEIRTDWETYKKALLDNGLDPAEYEAVMVPKLAGKKFWDFDMCHALRRVEELAYHVKETIIPTILAVDAPHPNHTRCYNSLVCGWCGYRELCVAEAKGEDVEFMKSTLYRIKGTGNPAIPVLEEDVYGE